MARRLWEVLVLVIHGIRGTPGTVVSGGCFCSRHQCWKRNKPLSRHSWGIALDANVKDNPYGKKSIMNPVIVEIFKRWGFCWGGDFKTTDGMHFEFVRFVYRRDSEV